MRYSLLLASVLLVCATCRSQNPSEKGAFDRTPEEVGRLVIRDLLSRPEFMMYRTREVTAVHYAEACAGYGALKLAGILNDTGLIRRLTARYDRVLEENIPNTANHVDANVYGILPLEMYLQTGKAGYLEHGLEFADGQWKDTLPGGLTSQTRFWIDDIYMIGCLQVQAFRSTGKQVCLDRAATEIYAYIDRLQQPNGLFYHGPDAPFFWGRGNGWVAAGLAELLAELPETHPLHRDLLEAYQKMMKTLAVYQSEDGMWHQLIDHGESFRESSSTAMFGFAMALGVRMGLLPEDPYQAAYVKAWNALTGYLDDGGKIREICVGTGQSQDISYYLDRPRMTGDLHGQAPLLWFAACLLADRD
jgi:unsaturated rhamnogalacturonyl hydrolase